MYNVTLPVIKMSILSLYARIFPQERFNRILLVLGAFIIAYSLATVFADIFQCVPISSLWDATEPTFCMNYPALIISTGVVNTVTDIIMLSLPMPLLWKLQLSTTKKKLITSLFLMGGLWVFSMLPARPPMLTKTQCLCRQYSPSFLRQPRWK
jgi:hypothetical protein